MASKPMPAAFQFSATGAISSARSRKVKLGKAVWVDSTAVGMTAVSTPQAEITGSATVSEHFPTQETSCTVTIRFIFRPSRMMCSCCLYSTSFAGLSQANPVKKPGGLKKMYIFMNNKRNNE